MVRGLSMTIVSAALLLSAGCGGGGDEPPKAGGGGGAQATDSPKGAPDAAPAKAGADAAQAAKSGASGAAPAKTGAAARRGAAPAAGPVGSAEALLARFTPEDAFLLGVLQPPRLLDSPFAKAVPQAGWDEMRQGMPVEPSAFELVAVVGWPAREGEPSVFEILMGGASPQDARQFDAQPFVPEVERPAGETGAPRGECGQNEGLEGEDLIGEAQFGPHGPGPRPPAVSGGVIFRLATPEDAGKFEASFSEGLEDREFEGQAYRYQSPVAVYKADERTFVFSTDAGLKRMLSAKGAGALTDQLAQSGLDHDGLLLVRMSDEVAKELEPALRQAPPNVRSMVQGLKSATLTLDADAEINVALRVEANDERTAQQIQQLVDDGLATATSFLPQAGQEMQQDVGEELADRIVDTATEILENKRSGLEGTTYSLRLTLPEAGQDVWRAMNAKIEERMAENRRMNDLRQIGIAFHNFHSVYDGLPAPAITGADGKPLLSWRVAVLPYLEEARYQRFKRGQAWDAAPNKGLLDPLPGVYTVEGQDTGNKTVYLMPVGEGTLFGGEARRQGDVTIGPRLFEITDGTSNTIMLIEVAPEHAVEWTRPADWQVDMAKPLEQLPETFGVLFADGSTDTYRKDPKTGELHGRWGTIDEAGFKALLTSAGGEPVNRFGNVEAESTTPPAAATAPPESR